MNETQSIPLYESHNHLGVQEVLALSNFFNASPMLMGIADLEGEDIRHVMDNPAAEIFFEVEKHSLQGKLASELGVPPEAIKLWAKHYREAERTRQYVEFDYIHKSFSGLHYLKATVNFLGKTDQGFSRFSYIVHDVTELQSTKQQLESLVRERTAELSKIANTLERELAQLEAVIQSVSDGIVVFNLEGELLLVNEAAAKLSGYKSSRDMKLNLHHYLDIFELSHLSGQKLTIEEWPLSKILKGEIIKECELMARRTDTRQSWVYSFSGQPVYNKEGQQILAVLVIRDVTEKRNFEDELERSNNILSTIMNSSEDVIFVKDRQGRLIYANPATMKLIGKGPEEIIGKGDAEFLAPDKGQDEVLANDKKVMESGHSQMLEEHVNDRIFMSAKAPFYDQQGNVTGLVGISRDITQRKAEELRLWQTTKDLEEAIMARDEFLSIASHELKTPLSSLTLQTQMFLRKAKKGSSDAFAPEGVLKLVEQTEKQLKRLARLVDDMLDISRIRTGKLTISKEEFDLCALVKNVIEQLRPQIKSANAEISINTCSLSLGHWDQFRIEQVVSNLITNAIRYGLGKPIVVSVSSEEDKVLLSVQDQGMGISPEDKERIFHRFERAISKNEVPGLGLGLYICDQIVKAHHGRIWVEPGPNQGSIFYVELPLR